MTCRDGCATWKLKLNSSVSSRACAQNKQRGKFNKVAEFKTATGVMHEGNKFPLRTVSALQEGAGPET